jgi:tetratricopeptide (TPR) repeat protein
MKRMERAEGTNDELSAGYARARAVASLLVVLLLSALATATTAHADALAKPSNAVAREHLTTGNRYYRVREFDKAIEEYKAGAVREDAPVFYYNLGQCYRQLGRYEDAIWHYERFLERGKPKGEIEASVRDFVVQMKAELEKKAMTQPPVEPAPPSLAISATHEQAPPTNERHGMPVRRKLAIGMSVGSIAILGLGLGLGLRSRGLEKDAASICPTEECVRADEANRMIERGRTSALYANVSFGIAAGAIVGASVLWLTSPRTKPHRTALAPYLSSDTAGLAVFTRF